MSMEIMQTITTTKMIIPLMIVIAIIMTVVLYDNTCSDVNDNDDISEIITIMIIISIIQQ